MLLRIDNLIERPVMTGPTPFNHRRERREIRRWLAEIVTRVRDPAEANSFWVPDFADRRRFSRDNHREDMLAVVTAREHH